MAGCKLWVGTTGTLLHDLHAGPVLQRWLGEDEDNWVLSLRDKLPVPVCDELTGAAGNFFASRSTSASMPLKFLMSIHNVRLSPSERFPSVTSGERAQMYRYAEFSSFNVTTSRSLEWIVPCFGENVMLYALEAPSGSTNLNAASRFETLTSSMVR
ncbi:hypothetical protein PF010_g9710 [Phytophthora fragariae]|uniref:Uncharacterized protein n=1 Tax=Phytophthora fragariae TaxID=53985 RepID=A0A6G0LBQ7_9STRA|nr:hypothetical protein PF010_g9710 [Phytophthora fragariae]